MKNKVCVLCGNIFIPDHPARVYCSKDCLRIVRNKYFAMKMREYRAKKRNNILVLTKTDN